MQFWLRFGLLPKGLPRNCLVGYTLGALHQRRRYAVDWCCNNILKRKYKGDERFVRIHKRIEEQNQKRERPIISAHEYEIAENLAKMKDEIDRRLFLDINILDNEPAFGQDVLSIIGKELIAMKIRADIKDRKYLSNLITTEYLQQRNYAY